MKNFYCKATATNYKSKARLCSVWNEMLRCTFNIKYLKTYLFPKLLLFLITSDPPLKDEYEKCSRIVTPSKLGPKSK